MWTGFALCDPVPASPREMCNTDPRDCSPVSNCLYIHDCSNILPLKSRRTLIIKRRTFTPHFCTLKLCHILHTLLNCLHTFCIFINKARRGDVRLSRGECNGKGLISRPHLSFDPFAPVPVLRSSSLVTRLLDRPTGIIQINPIPHIF